MSLFCSGCHEATPGDLWSSAGSSLRACLAVGFVATCLLTPLSTVQSQVVRTASSESETAEDESSVEIVYSLRATTEGALELNSGEGQKLEASLEPMVELAFDEGLRFTASGRFRGDALDELEPGKPSQTTTSPASRRFRFSEDTEAELREFYLELPTDAAYFIVGKQQTVWGQADGLKVLDVVNPQDFREFILDDFEDSRIPLWTFKAEVPIGDVLAELVWIPDTTYHDIPEDDATFAFRSRSVVPQALPGTTIVENDPDRPDEFVGDSDVGVRLSAFVGGWDVSFAYLYQYDDFQVPFQDRSAAPTIVVEPEFERTHLIGGTFSNAFGDFVVRGETALSTSRHFVTTDPSDPDGIEEAPNLNYVLGLDWYGLSNTLISGQLFQDIILKDTSGVTRDRTETTITLFARRSMVNDRLELSLEYLQGLNLGDGLVRPEVRYDLTDAVTVWGGADVFYGSSRGLFGQFDSRDRVVVGVDVNL